jgi:hypothetical protein
MTGAPKILLQLQLRLPTFQGEYVKQAQICAAENTPSRALLFRSSPLRIVVFKSRIFSARYLRGFLMKTARYSDAQIMGILKQAEGGVPVSELCREHGMSRASFYKWRSKFGGMSPQ